jgi:outer membrane protein assembly factor BamB
MTELLLLALMALSPTEGGQDWPQWLGPQRDGVWRESGILEKFPQGGPKLLWKAPVGGGYSGPAVSGGRVFVTERTLSRGVRNPENPFSRPPLRGQEGVLCLDLATGKEVWKHSYDCNYEISYAYGPRCTPVVQDGKVYTLGAMGDLFCLTEKDGKPVWSRHFRKEYPNQKNRGEAPVWGWSASPLIDGNKIICLAGGDQSIAVAFDKDTGKEIWRSLSAKEPGYAPPVIYTLAGKRQLIIWHPESVNGLDPETGRVFWSQPFALQAGLSVSMPRQLSGDRIFITAFYNGPMMLQITPGEPLQAKVLWKGRSNSEQRTDGLHSIMPTPFIDEGYIYGVCSYGQLRCLNAQTGERVWETFKATTGSRPGRWANAFLVRHDETGRYFLFNEKGELIIARLSPKGYEEIDRAKLIEPTQTAQGRDIVWTYPAFAQRKVLVRNDEEIRCYDLAK